MQRLKIAKLVLYIVLSARACPGRKPATLRNAIRKSTYLSSTSRLSVAAADWLCCLWYFVGTINSSSLSKKDGLPVVGWVTGRNR